MARAILKGMPISPGIAIAPLLLLPDGRNYEKRVIEEPEIEAEIAALNSASADVCAALKNSVGEIPDNLAEYRDIVASQMELARDPRILEGARGRIRRKKICAAWAIANTVAELSALFQDMTDPYLSNRAQDIRAIGKCLINALAGVSSTIKSGPPVIAAAWDISPADFMDYSLNGIHGLITVQGGATSHTAILARSLKAPAIAGVENLFQEARNNETVILDGFSGCALLGPDEEEISHYSDLGEKHAAFEQEAMAAALLPAVTRDGVAVTVRANMENPNELAGLEASGAEGIGLYRTEFAYMGARFPDENQLYREYLSILAGTCGELAVFRTLDAGADKILPVQEALHEPNPALGLRGIRFSLNRPDIFRSQLRAMLRAGAAANMAIMLPMITSATEVRQARAIIAELDRDLSASGIAHCGTPLLGVMVETPAAVLICQELAGECDFISLGTNDLLHYMMAIDRNNRHVSYLHEPFHPAFLRAIDHVVKASHACGRKVSVCGELAADPLGMAMLVGLGVDALSAAPRFTPVIKHLLRKLDTRECSRIAADALAGARIDITRERLRNLQTKSMDCSFQ